MIPLLSRPAGPLRGDFRPPGDKSISHRALVGSALACGCARITGLLEAEDVLGTATALRACGIKIAREADGAWRVDGAGVGGLVEPAEVLDLGNSGTAARLLLGVLAAHPFTAFLTGDASLRARPMVRVIAPLREIGAEFWTRSGGRLPLAVRGAAAPLPIAYRLPVPSAQVKSAILLAGLNAPGETSVIEPQPSRDHTERLLALLGAKLRVEAGEAGGRVVTLLGQPELRARPLAVPADPSSAAFALVAALVVPGSEVTVRGVTVNPLRTGLLETLGEMGAALDIGPEGETCGEPVARITARASRLAGVEVPGERAPRMIDEYPILAVAAACAEGTTVMRGLAELRVKESDRLDAIARGLAACGASAEIKGDTLAVRGAGGPPPGGGRIETRLDHRIAMAFLVLGAAARAPVVVDDGATIATSFPDFAAVMNRLGAAIEPAA